MRAVRLAVFAPADHRTVSATSLAHTLQPHPSRTARPAARSLSRLRRPSGRPAFWHAAAHATWGGSSLVSVDCFAAEKRMIAKSRVLVVDDEPNMAQDLRQVLSTQGYQVRTAAEGETALSSFDEWRPHLVFTDRH